MKKRILPIVLCCALLLCGCTGTAASSSVTSSKETSSAAASSKAASSKEASSAPASSAPVSSEAVSSEPASSAPVSSAAPVSSSAPVSSNAPVSSVAPASSAAASSKPAVTVIPETTAGGHYNNNISAAYSNYVLICGDYALEYFSSPSVNETYAAMVNTFAQTYPSVRVSCALVPKSCAFNSPQGYANQYNNQLNYITNTYSKLNGSVARVDVIGEMTPHAGEYMFYRTDHHWTSLGAYYASAAFCKANGITPRALSSYETVINTGFLGTLYSYSAAGNLRENLKQNLDYTVGHLPATGYTMTYVNGGVTYTGTAINKASVSYAGMFICGDQPFTRIVTENKNGKKLLIFKESYGNAFVPYMIDYFEEIIVVDIRSSTDSTASIISQYGITDALIINNVQASVSLSGSLQKRLVS